MFYILENDQPVKLKGDSDREIITRWAKWINRANRLIQHTEIDGTTISTVFLGVDLNFQDPAGGLPQVFETMVIHGLLDGFVRRAGTVSDAMNNHIKLLNMAYAARKDDTSYFPWKTGDKL